MSIEQFSYNNTDKEYFEIIEFLKEIAKLDKYLFWDSDRMNFWRYSVHGAKTQDASFFKENVKMWRDNNKIVGLFISEYGKNDAFIVIHPDYKLIYSDVFNWINNYWAINKEKIEIDVISDNKTKIKILEDNGYAFKCHFENLRYYNLEEINLSYKLEERFKIQAFFENPNFRSRVELVKSAFNRKEYNKQNLLSIHSSPNYIKELDLCVVSPNNQFVAYCTGWYDSIDENVGYIEPVGTHHQYRKRGFASAVIKECFNRLKENGKHTVVISSLAEPAVANFLYDSLQPSSKSKIFKYCKTK